MAAVAEKDEKLEAQIRRIAAQKRAIEEIVINSSTAPCWVTVSPLGRAKAVFITFAPETSRRRWRLLYKANSYAALLKIARTHHPPQPHREG